MCTTYLVSVYYLNERENESNASEIKAVILDSPPLDLIIGRPSMKKCGPVLQIPSQFENI